MKRLQVFFILMFTLIVPGGLSFLYAQDNSGLKISNVESVPDIYEVKKGDTLWDISKIFFKDPFQWPDIWKKNDFIKDPHWIYPGQKLNIKQMLQQVSAPEKKHLSVSDPEPVSVSSAPRTDEDEGVSSFNGPGFGSIPDESGVYSKLKKPTQVFTSKLYMRTGFIAKKSELPKNKVIKIEGDLSDATEYDYVVIDLGKDQDLKTGDTYAVIAVGDRVKHPDNGKDYGFVVRTIGILKVVSIGTENARCQVTDSFEPIETGDIVMPYALKTGKMFDAWVKPDRSLRGTVIAINEPMISVHNDDILYIDKGSEDKVKPGDRFLIYNRKESDMDTGHKETIGLVQAVNVMPSQTAVIVVSLKDKLIEIGDRVELVASCRITE